MLYDPLIVIKQLMFFYHNCICQKLENIMIFKCCYAQRTCIYVLKKHSKTLILPFKMTAL